jgi:hypothetical protein
LKFGNLNPYNFNESSNNIYNGLPNGFLMYRSCYPIRQQSSSVVCAKDATSINIRIYKLVEGSYTILKNNDARDYVNYDEWRDVAFYEYIRENVIKQKECSHFPLLYGYFICEKSNIDYEGIEKIKSNKIPIKNNKYSNPNPNNFPHVPKFENETKGFQKNSRPMNANKKTYEELEKEAKIKRKEEKNKYNGKSLILFTESATYPMISGWASTAYNLKDINKNIMIRRGIHSSDEWKNILFQIFVGLCVMFNHDIFINKFDIKKNLFIKDLPSKGQVINHWKYKLNHIEYFVPNLGFLVLIDSNFRDTVESSTLTFKKKTKSNTNKIGGSIFKIHQSHNSSDNSDNSEESIGSNSSERELRRRNAEREAEARERRPVPPVAGAPAVPAVPPVAGAPAVPAVPPVAGVPGVPGAPPVAGAPAVPEEPPIANISEVAKNNVKIINMFKNTFNVNNFKNANGDKSYCQPPDDIFNIIENIENTIENKLGNNEFNYSQLKCCDLLNEILDKMTYYLHNRIGTFLQENELKYAENNAIADFENIKKGTIIVFRDQLNNTYEIRIFKKKIIYDDGSIEYFMYKKNLDSGIIIEEIIDTNEIDRYFKYSDNNILTQDYKINLPNFNEENLLETYSFNFKGSNQ